MHTKNNLIARLVLCVSVQFGSLYICLSIINILTLISQLYVCLCVDVRIYRCTPLSRDSVPMLVFCIQIWRQLNMCNFVLSAVAVLCCSFVLQNRDYPHSIFEIHMLSISVCVQCDSNSSHSCINIEYSIFRSSIYRLRPERVVHHILNRHTHTQIALNTFINVMFELYKKQSLRVYTYRIGRQLILDRYSQTSLCDSYNNRCALVVYNNHEHCGV